MEQQKTVTLGKVIKVAFSNWKRLLIITASILAVGVLSIHFVYNRFFEKYTATFSYNKGDLNDNKYADGSDFYFAEIFSRSNFDKVKSENEQLASLDLDKMFNSNAITYSRTFDEDLPLYTLTIPKKYFSSYEQAKLLFKEVAMYPLDKENEVLNKANFESNLAAFDTSDNFEDQLNYLKSHAESLLSAYEALLKDESVGAPARAAIESNSSAIKSIVGEDSATLVTLKQSINKNGFVKDYNSESAKMFESTKNALQAEKSYNGAQIDALNAEIATMSGTSVILNSVDEAIAKLIQRNTEIQEEINAIDNKIAKQSDTSPEYLALKQEFANRLVSIRNNLSGCTDSFIRVLESIYSVSNEPAFTSTSVVSSKGNVSLPINIAVCLVAGIFVSAVVNLIVDRKKLFED